MVGPMPIGIWRSGRFWMVASCRDSDLAAMGLLDTAARHIRIYDSRSSQESPSTNLCSQHESLRMRSEQVTAHAQCSTIMIARGERLLVVGRQGRCWLCRRVLRQLGGVASPNLLSRAGKSPSSSRWLRRQWKAKFQTTNSIASLVVTHAHRTP